MYQKLPADQQTEIEKFFFVLGINFISMSLLIAGALLLMYQIRQRRYPDEAHEGRECEYGYAHPNMRRS